MRATFLRAVLISAGVVLLTMVAHEAAHIGTGITAWLSGFRARHPVRSSFLAVAAGPAMSWILLFTATVLIWRRQTQAAPHLTPLLAVAAGAGFRFVLLGIMALTQIAARGSFAFRNDEFAIASMTGTSPELLLLFEVLVALACWLAIGFRLRREGGKRDVAVVVGGLLLGFGSWMAVAHGFDVRLMK